MKPLRLIILLYLMSGGCFCGLAQADEASTKPNVLFIMFDDLRGDYKEVGAKTPTLDSLADQGITFNRAYAASPACGISRATLFTGLPPTRERFYPWNARADTDVPDAVTIPDFLRLKGYTTVSNGKVYHDPTDDRDGWTPDPRYRPGDSSWWPGQREGEPKHFRHWQTRSPKNPRTGLGPVYERGVQVDDNFYGEGYVVKKSIEDLQSLATDQKPFFLAVGFHRPHLPFNAPDRYWDMYSPGEIDAIDARIQQQRRRSPNTSPRFYHNWYEVKSYGGVPAKIQQIRENQQLQRNLVHGYLASITYSDAQLGKLLAALADPNGDGNTDDSIEDKTLVIVVSDHGFHLGENDIWAKARLWEIGLDSALIIKPLPGQAAHRGASTDALVSLLDVYPTIAEAVGFTPPAEVVGSSLWRLVENPEAPWRGAVISRFLADDAIRTDRFHYAESRNKEGKVVARMLHDMRDDPLQTTNLVKSKPSVVERLSKQLSAGWESLQGVQADAPYEGAGY